MTNPYRECVVSDKPKISRNIYRYILRTDNICPICKKQVHSTIMYDFVRYKDNPGYILCHPLKRIVVKGFWWWRKYCPVEGVHHHLTCPKCKVSWITMQPDQSEANPDIKDAYL